MKSPAFQFYPADFLADENVELMDNRATGCYIRLLSRCWIEGSIPADITKIGKLCKEDSSLMADLWLAIRPCFTEAEGKPGRLVNPRLEEERRKQEKYREERVSAGAKGAKSRWDKEHRAIARLKLSHGSANGSVMAQPMANDSSSSSSSSSMNTNAVEEEAKRDFLALVNRHFPKWVLSGESYKDLLNYQDTLPWTLMLKALQTTMGAGSSHINYCKRICEDWTEAKLQTLADVEAYEKRRERMKADGRTDGSAAEVTGHSASAGASGGRDAAKGSNGGPSPKGGYNASGSPGGKGRTFGFNDLSQ